jgi:hypothetical protein
LLAHSGLYARLYETQFARDEDHPEDDDNIVPLAAAAPALGA